MRKYLIWIAIFPLASTAFAKDDVVYFGGFQSTPDQMNCWKAGAENDKALKNRFSFRTVAYPISTGPLERHALTGGAQEIKNLVRAIDANTDPKKKFYLVGHSSGSALALAVASRVKDPSRIELIVLDGFPQSSASQKKVKTTCWYATTADPKVESLHAKDMRKCEKSEPYQATECQTSWCAHFALANKGVRPDLSQATYAAGGYLGCSTNLDYLSKAAEGKLAPDTPSFTPKKPWSLF